MTRVAFYIDGFNLYHALDGLGDATLKWLDLRALASSYLKHGQILERVVFFTALNTWDAPKRQRHVAYVTALEAVGVEVIRSRFDKVQKHCHTFERYCPFHEENQTDVAFAMEFLADCYEGRINRAFLITADSDHVPVVRKIRSRFPAIQIFLIAPPGRLKTARDLGKCVDSVFHLTAERVRSHPLPPEIRDNRGRLIIARPALYGAHLPA